MDEYPDTHPLPSSFPINSRQPPIPTYLPYSPILDGQDGLFRNEIQERHCMHALHLAIVQISHRRQKRPLDSGRYQYRAKQRHQKTHCAAKTINPFKKTIKKRKKEGGGKEPPPIFHAAPTPTPTPTPPLPYPSLTPAFMIQTLVRHANAMLLPCSLLSLFPHPHSRTPTKKKKQKKHHNKGREYANQGHITARWDFPVMKKQASMEKTKKPPSSVLD